MAHIEYIPFDQVPEQWQVDDRDNIIQIHSVHPRILRHHFELYVELMRRPGPLCRIRREMIAVVVSAENQCDY
jgi:alkylhydroperoxidase family enzyme